jgi:DNA-binding HxlR family transcriptional regulator
MSLATNKEEKQRCRQDPSVFCDNSCIYKRIIGIMGKKHTLDIIRILVYDQPVRFNSLQREINGSPKTLTDRLNEMCELGIIKREAFAEIPPRVEYSLSEKGIGLIPVMDAIKEWVQTWGHVP